MTSMFANSKAQGVRPEGRAGVLGPREAPQGPRAARAKRNKRHGGMGCPPWGCLAWGAPRKGGFQGGKPRRGASGTSLCTVPADFSVSSREGGGRGGSPAAGNSPPASCSATARVALLLALKTRAQRRGGAQAAGRLSSSQASRHRGAGRSLPTGPMACSCMTSQFLDCKPSGPCPRASSLLREDFPSPSPFPLHSSSSSASSSASTSSALTLSTVAAAADARAAG